MQKRKAEDIWYMPDTCYIYKNSIVLLLRVSGGEGLIELISGERIKVSLAELSRIGKRVFYETDNF
jgi:hypothetical protein